VDIKHLNEELKESTARKGGLQLTLNELQASDVSLKASSK
jgi:nucleoprotein TPR